MNRTGVDCWLLTGATGLVGRFVLAELLREGQRVGALVRERATATASARIEECLAPFETQVALLRPRPIAFDLGLPGLGISQADQRWLVGKRLGVIHSAASIRFVSATPEDEPYLSNVVGTRHLLDFLRDLEVDNFLYVSTAYVTSRAGQDRQANLPRQETAVARGAVGGNDYETSKMAAEQMILDCGWLKSKTIVRPSIIVGDSNNGYTSTFHGFYAPLQIGNQFIKVLGAHVQAGEWFRSQLGLQDSDTKNFVPVDWVSRAIVRIALHPQLHGLIYHLTNPQPVSCADAQSAIEQALRKLHSPTNQATAVPTVPAALPANFREQMAVYESYFNNDPVFDCSNTRSKLPELPCPRIDVATLIKLADYALRVNFGWPRASLTMPAYTSLLERFRELESVAGAATDECIQLQVVGLAAPPPLFFAFESSRWRLALGPPEKAADSAMILIAASDLAACLSGHSRLAEMVAAGKMHYAGTPKRGWTIVLDELQRDLKVL